MTRVYVSDTNIWIDFRNAGLLDQLFRLPLTLCCTDFVLNELQDLQHETLIANGLLVESLDAAAMGQLFNLMTAHNNSSLADVSCYLLAQDKGWPLLTGDGRLRKQALTDGLEVFGALWLLDQLVAHVVVSPAEAGRGLQAMLARGARLPTAECTARMTAWAG
ncbi:MAG: type II toxin-antitoxin system VapC family toxin [Comamonadaceae bacterium]|nr:MAG: type II toxin-antitoxin system VapC family toxin [Comamonadaceae bacterium]